MDDGWTEVGAKPVKPVVKVMQIPNPNEDREYKRITSELQKWHGDLLAMEKDGRLSDAPNNPTLVSEYLAKLRLNCNMLFAFLNNYIDVKSDLERLVAEKRQALYEDRLMEPKGTPSSAEAHSKAMTRVDEANVKQIENRIQQIKNEYERYNGICIFLQSKMKEFNTERIMG